MKKKAEKEDGEREENCKLFEIVARDYLKLHYERIVVENKHKNQYTTNCILLTSSSNGLTYLEAFIVESVT